MASPASNHTQFGILTRA